MELGVLKALQSQAGQVCFVVGTMKQEPQLHKETNIIQRSGWSDHWSGPGASKRQMGFSSQPTRERITLNHLENHASGVLMTIPLLLANTHEPYEIVSFCRRFPAEVV